MTPQVISLSSATSSAWIPVDYKQNPFNISLAVVLSNTPSLTCKVEYTLDDVFNTSISPTVFSHSSLVGLTANSTGTIKSPVRAIRLTISSWTSGTATLTAIQGGVDSTGWQSQEELLDIHESAHEVLGTPKIQSPIGSGRFIIEPPVVGITTAVSGSCTINTSEQAELFGETVWKITCTSVGAAQYIELNIPTQNAFSCTDSTVEMYLNDPTQITTITQYIGTTSYTRNIQGSQSSVNSPTTSRAPRMKGWNSFQTSKAMWTKSGSLAGLEIGDQLWTIGKIRVSLASDVTTTFYLRSVHVNASHISRIAIVWDDGYDSSLRIGVPILEEYRLRSTMAVIPTIVGNAGQVTLSDLRRYVDAGNACCPHGPNTGGGGGNLFSAYADNASRLADVIGVRNYILDNNLARGGSENCYVWPQGVFCDSTTDVSFLKELLDNGFTVGRGITATINQYHRCAAISSRNENRLILNIVGHSWSVADEPANIATVISRIQAAAADGFDCILMFHKVVGEDAAATTIEISTNRLRALCSAIATLISAGTMQSALLPELDL